jgi:ribosomal-protein-alanine N-acetyltransferase
MSHGDIPGVCEIENQTKVCAWGVKGYKEVLEGDYVCLVCEEENKIVGFAVMRVVSEEAEVLNLAVSSSWEGCGIGSGLIEECKKLAKARGASEIWLEVRCSNFRARSFYEKHGFFNVCVRKNFYENPVEDALVMKCEVVKCRSV